MKWETPTFVEINMSAEIGGYQSDFSDRVLPANGIEEANHRADTVSTDLRQNPFAIPYNCAQSAIACTTSCFTNSR